jgi:glycosyltransferase involved in cell wall biosynthesis
VNLLAVDDVSKQGTRLTQRLQNSLSAGGADFSYCADTAEARNALAGGGINLFSCRLEGLADFMLRRGLAQFEGRYNIACAAWETDRLPQSIKIALDLLDEIWVASAHEKALFEKETATPVFVLPCPVNEAAPDKAITRAGLGLPEDAFLFTAAVDCNDMLSRKNILGTILAFQAAFKGSEKAGLLIKTRDIAGAQREDGLIQKLQKLWNANARIFTVHDELNDAEMQGLLHVSDAYISLHRGSVFGAAMVEAMLLGKPVIATEGLGPADYFSAATGFPVKAVKASVVFDGFASLDFEPGHGWLDPDISDAARAMNQVFAQRDAAQKIAAAGQKRVQARYSAQSCGAAMAARLAVLAKGRT